MKTAIVLVLATLTSLNMYSQSKNALYKQATLPKYFKHLYVSPDDKLVVITSKFETAFYDIDKDKRLLHFQNPKPRKNDLTKYVPLQLPSNIYENRGFDILFLKKEHHDDGILTTEKSGYDLTQKKYLIDES